MSPERSSETLYHALPHASSSSLLDTELDETGSELAVDPPPVLIDPRIRWIHFILGCSVLLPWNGTVFFSVYYVFLLLTLLLKP